MATYITLYNFTDQGIRNIEDTTRRANSFIELAKSQGVTVKDIFWTLGQYDIVAVLEAPDDTVVTRLDLVLAIIGNVRTQTLRAFSLTEMNKILTEVSH